MEKKKNTWGGARPNSGRPLSPNKKEVLSVRLSPEIKEFVNQQTDKSQYIERLIMEDRMRYATLTNKVTGQQVRVHATTEHPDSSYGKAVWVDEDNNAYMQVDGITPNPFYTIQEDSE